MSSEFTSDNKEFFEKGIDEFLSNIEYNGSIDINTDEINNWFTTESKDYYEVVKVYWVEPIFEYVRIHTNGDEYIYEIVKPEFQNKYYNICDDISSIVSLDLENIDDNIYNSLFTILKGSLGLIDKNLTSKEILKLVYIFKNSNTFHGTLSVPIKDDLVYEIYISPDEPIYIYHSQYDNITCNIKFKDNEIESYIDSILNSTENDVSDQDIGSVTTENIRIHFSRYADYMDSKEPTLTIRTYVNISTNPIDIMKNGMLSSEEFAYLWTLVSNRKSIILYGGTSTGKTTILESLIYFIPKDEKISCVQDYNEITPINEDVLNYTPQNNNLSKNEPSVRDLLKSSLRHRPNYILVGEIRGSCAKDIFSAMSTGHTVYTTMHADSYKSCINRMNLDPINIKLDRLINIDVLVGCDQNRRGDRYVSNIYELFGFSDDYNPDLGLDIDIKKLEDPYESEHIETYPTKTKENMKSRNKLLKLLLDNNITDNQTVYKIISLFDSEYINSDSNDDLRNWLNNNHNININSKKQL